VESAVTKRTPFCESFPNSVATRYVAKLVSGLERYVTAKPQLVAKVSQPNHS